LQFRKNIDLEIIVVQFLWEGLIAFWVSLIDIVMTDGHLISKYGICIDVCEA
jgi:hypothetical protein